MLFTFREVIELHEIKSIHTLAIGQSYLVKKI